jgi:hypothetical protein
MKAKREELLALVEESDKRMKDILREDYIHFTDAFPGIKDFLKELEIKERAYPVREKTMKSVEDDKEGDGSHVERKGYTPMREVVLKEVDYNPDTFNPFDMKNIREHEKDQESLKPRKKLNVKKAKKTVTENL